VRWEALEVVTGDLMIRCSVSAQVVSATEPEFVDQTAGVVGIGVKEAWRLKLLLRAVFGIQQWGREKGSGLRDRLN
jgi:hypothetical protein